EQRGPTMFTPCVCRLTLVFGVLLCGSGGAFAQYNKKPPAELPAGSVRGEVKGVRSGALIVADSNTNQAYFVQVAPQAKKVDITGEGDVLLLKAGMFVRFDIKMDKQGNGKEDLKKIELFTPDPQIARTGTEPKGGDDYTVAGQVRSFVSKTGKLTVDAPGDKPNQKVTVKAQVSKEATLDVGVRGGQWLG